MHDLEDIDFSAIDSVETPPCPFCGQVSYFDMTGPDAAAWRSVPRKPVQDIFPDMPSPQREQLFSGTHPDCWTRA